MGCNRSKLKGEKPLNGAIPENGISGTKQTVITCNGTNICSNENSKKYKEDHCRYKECPDVPNGTINRGYPIVANGRIRGHRTRRREIFDPRITVKYDIKLLIGKGSFSRVLKVEHRITKQPFALKIIDLKEGCKFVENELSILARLRHPYIIQMVEVFRSTTRIYMILELATGGDLFDRIVSKGYLSELETIKILRMLLDALIYLHKLGVTHRDLKPENVLYYHPGYESNILISDFGLAHQRAQGEEDLMTTTCGTPEYIAPEVLLRQPYTNKVDMWAIGVLCYIMLSGTMPFDDDSRTRIYRAILKAKYDFPDEFWADVSENAKHFVRTLLDPDPKRRPSAVQILHHPWISYETYETRNKQKTRSLHKSHSHQPNEARRTRSNKSVRSIARSDAGHRVDVAEIERLQKDPEFQHIISKYSSKICNGNGNTHSQCSTALPNGPFTARVIAVV